VDQVYATGLSHINYHQTADAILSVQTKKLKI